jgi:hypothetical protein
METYYSDKLAEKSYMIGYLQFTVQTLADIILTTTDNEYSKIVAQDAIEKLKNLETEAQKAVETINQKIATMSAEEGR